MIINNLKKKGDKLRAHSVDVLRESRGPVNGTEGVINGIKVSFVMKSDLSVRLMTA